MSNTGTPQTAVPLFVFAQLNARLQPLDRGEHFEDPLDEQLKNAGLGEVCGDGTQQCASGEILWCAVEIEASGPGTLDAIVRLFEELGAPKGSLLKWDGQERPFGVAEGLALYLNGTDLPAEVYASCHGNEVYEEIENLLGGDGRILSHWQGPTETAVYLYGASYERMKTLIADFVASYPLCQRCRIEQIA